MTGRRQQPPAHPRSVPGFTMPGRPEDLSEARRGAEPPGRDTASQGCLWMGVTHKQHTSPGGGLTVAPFPRRLFQPGCPTPQGPRPPEGGSRVWGEQGIVPQDGQSDRRRGGRRGFAALCEDMGLGSLGGLKLPSHQGWGEGLWPREGGLGRRPDCPPSPSSEGHPEDMGVQCCHQW